MTDKSSSVLIVSHPDPKSLDIGADHATDLARAMEIIQKQSYPVVVFPIHTQSLDESLQFFSQLTKTSPLCEKVLVRSSTSVESLKAVTRAGKIFQILSDYTSPHLQNVILAALAEYDLEQQNLKLLELLKEQNEKLKRLSVQLRQRSKRRENYIQKARFKLENSNKRIKAMHKAIVAIHAAETTIQMEQRLTEALVNELNLAWTKIRFHSQSALENFNFPADLNIYEVSLMGEHEAAGQIFFAKENSDFASDEQEFLDQVAEAVGLAMNRLHKFQQMETLKHQWDATFDAVLHPLSVIGFDHKIIRYNKAFARLCTSNLIGKHCYRALFDRSTPCTECQLGQEFRLPSQLRVSDETLVFEINSQKIRFPNSTVDVYVNIYKNINEQLRLENQILESAKLAELGTIGSSIAHELNNPLAGMLAFVQLIQKYVTPDHPAHGDIKEMENGVYKCKDIIDNLLGFTRRPDLSEISVVDLRAVIEQSLKITEIQSRSKGILLSAIFPDEAVLIPGQFGLLSQSIRNILQNSYESIIEKQKFESEFNGEIKVELIAGERIEIRVSDNGVGIPDKIRTRIFDPLFTTKDPNRNPGLGLTVTYQIVSEHHGQLEISSVPGQSTTATISFSRPDLPLEDKILTGKL